ncbi:ATR-interacting protein-like isoform X2 [Ptychodera flava]|uniref:ATR-interacting protein-like isoform X2 n=1 Tax=Ptychodera flava TaxID=63121 RepID=UPI00396A3C24
MWISFCCNEIQSSSLPLPVCQKHQLAIPVMNPLFSGPGAKTKRSPFYASAKNESGPKQTNVNLTHHGGSTDIGEAILPAPSKKPRMSLEPDPFDDFPDDDFTEGDFEAMELIASQAMNQNDDNMAGPSDKPTTAESVYKHNLTQINKPISSTFAASASTSGLTHQSQNKTLKQSNVNYISSGKLQPQKGKQKLATSSKQETVTHGKLATTPLTAASSSKFPSYQSNIDSAGAQQTGGSKDIKTSLLPESKNSGHQSGQFMKKFGETAGNLQTPQLGSKAKDASAVPIGQDGRVSPSMVQQELDKLKTECANYKKQLTSLQEERYKTDGEIKILREKVQQTNSELNKVQTEKFNIGEELKREQLKKEKEASKQVENMKTQLQFKEMEIVDIQNKYKSLERKLKVYENSSNGTPKNSPHKQHGSHHNRTGHQSATSPGKPNNPFPTRRSFLSHSGPSTPPRSPKLQSLQAESPLAHKGPRSPGQVSSPRRKDSGAFTLEARQKKLPASGKINTCSKRGLCSSPQLVSKLLSIDQNSSYNSEPPNQGLVTLLQLPAVNSTHHAAAEEYGIAGALKTNRSAMVSSPERWSPFRMTSDENHRAALKTLSSLLSKSQTTVNSSPGKANLELCSQSSSIGLLPVIQDHLFKYIDMLHSKADSGVPSTFSGSTASRTLESSTADAGSTRSLEYDQWVFGQTEKATLNALAVLQRLICNSCCVRTALLKSSPDQSGGSVPTHSGFARRRDVHGHEANISIMEIDPSAPLIPETQAATQLVRKHRLATDRKPSDRSPCLLTDVPVNSILTKVLRIASIHNMYGQSSSMLQATLDVLMALAENSEPSGLDRLQALLTDGTVQNCLASDNSYSIVSTAVSVLNVTVCSRAIAQSLCNQSESCTLLRLYQLCAKGVDEASEQQWTALQIKILQFFATLFSCHHGTVSLLVESDCDCSVEVVKALITMLHNEYKVLCTQTLDDQLTSLSLQVLRQGMVLLHYLCIYDRLFVSHRLEVELYYVKVVSAMSAVYKELPDITEHEVTVIQELWDFEQPDEMWSPDGEDEDETQMETD